MRAYPVALALAAAVAAATLPAPAHLSGDAVLPDVFALMEEADRRADPGLWPGFSPRRIPAAVFDGVNTYLFGFGRALEGFVPVRAQPDVRVFPGQHPDVCANRRVRIEGTWVATIVLGRGPSGNHRMNTPADIAGLVLHEKFHVFQSLRHPGWRPNDLVLLTYPLDRSETLARRRLELKAFRRAAEERSPERAAAWAGTGLDMRRERLSGLSSAEGRYERELARFEGLAQYVEDRTAGRLGFNDGLADDIAPRGIRLLGYIEGCWMARLLDRFDPAWKERLETDDAEYLEALLDRALAEAGSRREEFTPAELIEAEAAARLSVETRTALRRKLEREFFNKLGYRFEIWPVGGDIHFEMFDPFSIEALGERRILHLVQVSCRTASGTIKARWRACLTELDRKGKITRMILTGIRNKPALPAGMNVPLRLNEEGIEIETGRGRLRYRMNILEIGIDN